MIDGILYNWDKPELLIKILYKNRQEVKVKILVGIVETSERSIVAFFH